FLADVELICEECRGTRYKASVLDIRYKGKNIHDVLNLTVKEALQFFSGVPKITDKLRVLEEVGLGYLRLGQSATTLSGGEAQRMKLAAHLSPRSRDERSQRQSDENGAGTVRKSSPLRTLYIFDEQTSSIASTLLAHAEGLLATGDYSAAQPLLKQATEKDPKSYQAWYDLGYCEEALNHNAEALSAYKKSLEISPKIYETNLNLGL